MTAFWPELIAAFTNMSPVSDVSDNAALESNDPPVVMLPPRSDSVPVASVAPLLVNRPVAFKLMFPFDCKIAFCVNKLPAFISTAPTAEIVPAVLIAPVELTLIAPLENRVDPALVVTDPPESERASPITIPSIERLFVPVAVTIVPDSTKPESKIVTADRLMADSENRLPLFNNPLLLTVIAPFAPIPPRP